MNLKDTLADHVWGISLAGRITTPNIRTSGFAHFSGFFCANRDTWKKGRCGFFTRTIKGQPYLLGSFINLEVTEKSLNVRAVLKSLFGGKLYLGYDLSSPELDEERKGLSLRGCWINGVYKAPAGCSIYLPQNQFDLWGAFRNLQKQN